MNQRADDSPVASEEHDEITALKAQVARLDQRLACAGHRVLLPEQIPAVSWVTDRDLRFTASAGSALLMLGAQPGDAVGQTIMEWLGVSDPNATPIREHRRALAGETAEYEYGFRGRFFQCRVEPLHSDVGEITGTVGVALDITERVRLEEALRHRIAIESLLTDISRHFVNLRSEEIDGGINDALRRVGELVGVDRSYVFQFSPDNSLVSNTHEWCAEGIEPQIASLQETRVDSVPWWMDQLKRLETIHIPAVDEMPPEASAERAILQAQKIQSLIAMPLTTGGRLLGFLGFDSVRARKLWEPEDAALLGAIGEIFAGALARSMSERALRESEAVSRSLMDANPDIVFRFSRDGTHLTCHVSEDDRRWLHTEDLIGRKVTEAHSPEFAALCTEAIDRVLTERSVQEYEHREPADRGGRFWEVRAAPCGRDEVLMIVRDVTRRKTTEAELRERDRFLSSIISNLPGYVYRCRNDPDWTMEYLSDGIHEMLGFEARQLVVECSVSIGDLIHPEDRKRVWDDVQAALRERRRFQVVYRLGTASGDYRWVWEQGVGVFRTDGSVEAIEGFVADITERKIDEESLARSHRLLRLTLNEMDHRVRNNLAAITALIDLTAKKHDTVASFSESIKSRIQAMGLVHAALSRNRWSATTLRDLIATLMPAELDSALHLDGPDVQVSPRQSAATGMVLHELFANSLKYGALRDPGGRVEVSWHPRPGAPEDEEVVLDLTWREHCTAPIRKPAAEGLGTQLMHGVVRTELRGRAALGYTETGAHHRLMFRLEKRGPGDAVDDGTEAAASISDGT